MISSETGIRMVMGNCECDSYIRRLKDVEFIVTYVGL